jgi:RHS repeat-associated protein
VDGTGTTNYSVHPYGQLGAGQTASVDGPLANDTINYAYDERGRVVSRSLNSVTSTWSYDQQGRLSSQGDPIGAFSYTYDGNSGRPAALSYPNGQTTTYAYFPNSGGHRLQQIHHKQPGGATLNKFDYTYDVVGNIEAWTQQTDANPAQVYDLEYDPADQLIAATLMTSGQPPTILKRYRYAYDPAGNRIAEQIDDAVTGANHDNMNRLLSHQPGGILNLRGTVNEPANVTIQGQPAAVDASNRFTGSAPVPQGTSNVVVTATDPAGNLRTNTYQVSGSGSTRTFTYDNNGNLASKVEGAVTTTYEWDAENRLLAVKQGANTLASFSYDGSGRRATKTAGGVTTTYVYDGSQFLEERPSAGATKRYVYGLGPDHVLAQVVSGTISYNVVDHLGSVVRTTDSTGMPVLTREYDPWGNLVQGSTSSGYAFTGREWDAEIELHYYRSRYYSASLGRFVSEDPISLRGGLNLFAYVGSSPLQYRDPSGLLRLRITLDIEHGGGVPFHGNNAYRGLVDVQPDCRQCPGGGSWTLEFQVVATIVMQTAWPCPEWTLKHEQAEVEQKLQELRRALAPLEAAEGKYPTVGECYKAGFDAMKKLNLPKPMTPMEQVAHLFTFIPCTFPSYE